MNLVTSLSIKSTIYASMNLKTKSLQISTLVCPSAMQKHTKSIKLKGDPCVICSFQTEQILKKMQTKSGHKFID